MAPWSIESYCEAQQPSDWTLLHAQSQSFLEALNLPRIHPFCSENAPNPFDIPGIPAQGPLLTYDHLESTWDMVVTFIAMAVPSLASLGELWLRLFASVIAPLGIAHLIWKVQDRKLTASIHSTEEANANNNKREKTILSIICLLSVASSVVILTDTLYVLEYGPWYGATLLVASGVLSLATAVKHRLYKTIVGQICLLVLLVHLIYDYETGLFQFGHPDDVVRINEGLYYDKSNSFISKIVDHWPVNDRTYSVANGATPWMPTGDSRTGLPFLLNKVDAPTWTRVWLPVDDGAEVVAIDISFPKTGHDISNSKPLYLILHGLNGGSQEEYVKDFAWRRNSEGSTVCVMVARGLMDLPVRGWDVFHGARWTDAHSAALALRAGLGEGQLLAGVGFSMGGIIMGNYVARSGADCALDAAMAISGGLDMRYETDFYRAQRLWQPLLTETLRNDFVIGKWGERVRERLTKEQMKMMMRATHISEIDKTAVVAYNGFRDLEHYYSEMSLLGDIPMNEHRGDTQKTKGRVDEISIPFCVVHSLDDPLITWRSVAANEGLLHPDNLTQRGSGNLLILLTKQGGHVGWSLGWNPASAKWKWMNDVAMTFVEAVGKARDTSRADEDTS